MHFFKSLAALLACASPMASAAVFYNSAFIDIWVQKSTGENKFMNPIVSDAILITDGWAFVWYNQSDKGYCNGYAFTWDSSHEYIQWSYWPTINNRNVTPVLLDYWNNPIPQSGEQACVYTCQGLFSC
ncbi:hypothetical protein V8E54_002187 [Elaphomyces granulatus]